MMGNIERCACICHSPRGVVGQGGTYIYDDDRGIRHEDWSDCTCCAADYRGAVEALRAIVDVLDYAKAEGPHADRPGIRGIGAGEAEKMARLARDFLGGQ